MSDYPHKFSVAPMMDWTTSECRQFHRILSQRALLYTEMVTTGAILHAGAERFLKHESMEHPLALQLGGSDYKQLSDCASIGESYGYQEINLNAGCPSDRVQNGMIGAILMAHATLVKDCMKAMLDRVSIPVTLKHRIGIDDFDSYEFLRDFVGEVAESGCDTFIVHARKAILQGLSPKENRDIPPLDYDRVLRLKADFPQLNLIINGGIKDHQLALSLMDQGIDGVMLGREAYQNPLMLLAVDPTYYQQDCRFTEANSLNAALIDWVQQRTQQGVQLKYLVRHMLGLYSGLPGSKKYRRLLSENMTKENADTDLFCSALKLINTTDFLF